MVCNHNWNDVLLWTLSIVLRFSSSGISETCSLCHQAQGERFVVCWPIRLSWSQSPDSDCERVIDVSSVCAQQSWGYFSLAPDDGSRTHF
jgi:hypothetical protein